MLNAIPLAVALLLSPGASANGFHPLVSEDSRSCYSEAMADLSHDQGQCALAKLESLLMKQPVTVGIDTMTLPFASKTFGDAVNQGMAIWSSAITDSPFVLATGNARPMVLVKFVEKMDNPGDGDLQGLIEAQHEYRWSANFHSNKLVSTMYIVYHTEGRKLTQSELAEVVSHELGHLLGLTDNDAPRGLMGPFVAGYPRLAPSTAEIAAVNDFRQTLRDAIAKAERKA